MGWTPNGKVKMADEYRHRENYWVAYSSRRKNYCGHKHKNLTEAKRRAARINADENTTSFKVFSVLKSEYMERVKD